MTPNTNKNTDSVDIPTVDNNQPMTFIQTKVEGFIDTFLHSDRVVSNIIGKKDTYTYRFKRQVNCYSMIRWLTTTLTACLEEGKRMERNRILEIAKAEHSVSYGESAKAQEIIIRRIEALTPIKPHYGAGVEYEYTTPTTMSHQPSKSNETLTTTETIKFVLEKHGHRDIQDGTYKHIEQIVERAKDAEREKAVEEFRKDKERLDFLDRCNLALNDHYKTNYGWKLILNHNVARLMSEGGLEWLDLNDAEGGNKKHKSCRDAIDEALTPPEVSNDTP